MQKINVFYITPSDRFTDSNNPVYFYLEKKGGKLPKARSNFSCKDYQNI